MGRSLANSVSSGMSCGDEHTSDVIRLRNASGNGSTTVPISVAGPIVAKSSMATGDPALVSSRKSTMLRITSPFSSSASISS